MVKGASVHGKSGLTLTDDLTQRNIAKGTVSPTFFDSGGMEHWRGVVQADAVLGNDLSYLDGVYTSPNNPSHSSHTGGQMSGTMTVPPGRHAGSVVHGITQKLGMIGLLIAGFIVFIIVERR